MRNCDPCSAPQNGEVWSPSSRRARPFGLCRAHLGGLTCMLSLRVKTTAEASSAGVTRTAFEKRQSLEKQTKSFLITEVEMLGHSGRARSWRFSSHAPQDGVTFGLHTSGWSSCEILPSPCFEIWNWIFVRVCFFFTFCYLSACML